MDIKDRLLGLHEQATKERSHFYVGKCCQDAIDELDRLKADKECLEDLLDSNVSSLGKQLADLGRERNRYREALEAAKDDMENNDDNGAYLILCQALKGEDG